MLIPIMAMTSWLLSGVPVAGESASAPCLMRTVAPALEVPASGFIWLPGGDFSGTCEEGPSDGWLRRKSGALELSVNLDGPEGSGRFWKVVLGIPEKQQPKPVRGVCIRTSTVGWRTLQNDSKGALPWLDDLNDDGIVEFLLWDSFPLSAEASTAEYALVAWVYRLVSADSLLLDLDLSRGMARSLAREYRSPSKGATGSLGELRAQAAEALEKLAQERCSLVQAEVR